MVAPIKVTNGQRLFDQLEELFSLSDEPSEFQIRRLRMEAEKLVKVDAGEGYIVLAGIAALQWDREEAASKARNAVALDKSHETLMNAALTMRNVHDVELSNEFLRFEIARDNPHPVAFSRAVSFLLCAGEIEEAATVMRRASDAGFSLEGSPDAVALLDTVSAIGLSLDEIKREFSAVNETLFECKKRPRGFSFDVHTDPDGGTSLVARFEVLGSFMDELALEESLAAKLIDLEEWNPVRFSIELACTTENANATKRAA